MTFILTERPPKGYSEVMKSKGFTLIELLVVIVVIGIISSVAIAAYVAAQQRSSDAAVKAAAASLKSGLERYYNRNNEYPSAATMFGSTPNGTAVTNKQSISTLVDITNSALSDDRVIIVPCSGTATNCTPLDATNRPKNGSIYYYTKTAAVGTAQTYNFSTCDFTFAASEPPNAAYFIAIKTVVQSTWDVSKSNKGVVITANSGACPFTAL